MEYNTHFLGYPGTLCQAKWAVSVQVLKDFLQVLERYGVPKKYRKTAI